MNNCVIEFLKEVFIFKTIKLNSEIYLLRDRKVYDVTTYIEYCENNRCDEYYYKEYTNSYCIITSKKGDATYLTYYNGEFYLGAIRDCNIMVHKSDLSELTNLYLLYTRKKKLEILEKI